MESGVRRHGTRPANHGNQRRPGIITDGVMTRATRYPPEVRQRAVRMVLEHRSEYESEWAAICSIASKFGCSSETLRNWVRQAERDRGDRAGLTSDQLAELPAPGGAG